ncbi:hypothetical protein ElyMa_001840300 [Elysia marginata]|uniref:SSD domain-containing protein n=1 Tax=Elysia marginata TaxID=1093978 RepID=A0AAV4EKD7_9GAST|nr:hypothetical protein ElyMa_001840300 [Elysia marginata]
MSAFPASASFCILCLVVVVVVTVVVLLVVAAVIVIVVIVVVAVVVAVAVGFTIFSGKRSTIFRGKRSTIFRDKRRTIFKGSVAECFCYSKHFAIQYNNNSHTIGATNIAGIAPELPPFVYCHTTNEVLKSLQHNREKKQTVKIKYIPWVLTTCSCVRKANIDAIYSGQLHKFDYKVKLGRSVCLTSADPFYVRDTVTEMTRRRKECPV